MKAKHILRSALASRGPSSAVIALTALLLLATPASALQVTQHSFSSSFTGAGSTAGSLSGAVAIAVSKSTGNVYVLSGDQGVIDQFTGAGVPLPWDALDGSTSLSAAGHGQLAIDNSPNAESGGRIYLDVPGGGGGQLLAYRASGEPVGGNFPFTDVGVNGVATDPVSGNFWVLGRLTGFGEKQANEYTPTAVSTGTVIQTDTQFPGSMAMDSKGGLYIDGTKYSVDGTRQYVVDPGPSGSAQEILTVDPTSDNVYVLDGSSVREYNKAGTRISTFALSGGGTPQGLAVGPQEKIYVAFSTSGGDRVDLFGAGPAITVPDTTTDEASHFQSTSLTLNGTVSPEETPTNRCEFEWGPTTAYGSSAGCEQGTVLSGAGQDAVSAGIGGLTKGTTYHYRLVTANATPNSTAVGRDRTATPADAPAVSEPFFASGVHSDSATLHGAINPEGGETTYRFEYGEAECTLTACLESPPSDAGFGLSSQAQSTVVTGLAEGTSYHYRIVAENQTGKTFGPERTFRTFRRTVVPPDLCPNVHVRQQTGAALLPDCRAYELTSAANTGGYDVESSLVAGQTPFGGYSAGGTKSVPRVLYGIHGGGIPGVGSPTNQGVDPYVATRGSDGWNTEYVGIPADDPYATGGPFASSLQEADPGLDTFVFGGDGICSPCFPEGYTGIPVHLPDGSLVQGMLGPQNPGLIAKPDGYIAKTLSANGEHLLFGSTSLFASGGNSGGDVSIYDHNLKTGTTHVVSNTPSGEDFPEPLTCLQGLRHCNSENHDSNGISALDISADGSHIVLGQKVVTDAVGNPYWHLYMNINDSIRTIDLTPGASDGVLFDGMTTDGSQVFFTTKDALVEEDEDLSADIYVAEVSTNGAKIRLISIGTEGTGNSDACEPAANTEHAHWNTVGSDQNCGVVGIGGGGGVAPQSGALYFLSPEQLAGSAHGVLNAPNLFVAMPGGALQFVATLESSLNGPVPAKVRQVQRSFGAFEKPTGVAFDAQGNSYVLDLTSASGGGYVEKFNSSGHLDRSFGVDGRLDGSEAPTGAFAEEPAEGLPAQIAVDNTCANLNLAGLACSSFDPSDGDLYVPDLLHGVVDRFSPSGAYFSQIEVFSPVGVAVNQATGEVTVARQFLKVKKYDSGGAEVGGFFPEQSPANAVAVDSNGNTYLVEGEPSVVDLYDGSGEFVKTLDSSPSFGVAVDHEDNVYVDHGNAAIEFDPSGNQVGAPFGSGSLSGSVGLSVDSAGTIDLSNRSGVGSHPGSITSFGLVSPPSPRTDNPLVIDSVSAPEARKTADFQATPSGDTAVFPSTLPLTGFQSDDHAEVFRFSSSTGLDCVSCNLTNARAIGDSALTANGLNLSADGRVFFDSREPLDPRDLDENEDVYEWEPLAANSRSCTTSSATFNAESEGCIYLISTGTSHFASRLLGISAAGEDAYFFTRDQLVQQDENGPLVKIYDAREDGGFSYAPSLVPCKASDECHGAGSPAPSAPDINSIRGGDGNIGPGRGKPQKCKVGYLRRHGRCIRKPKSHRHRKHQHGQPEHGGRK
jgi:hypothetical protein